MTGSGTRPPWPTGAAEGPLPPNETATLWSKTADACQLRDEATDEAVQELASCTDVTFKEPPHTAATWTRSDFDDLSPGDRSVSVAPSGAGLVSNRSIVDAHASFFAVQPATQLHRAPGDDALYIAPNGSVRGLVDYRVQTPTDRTNGDRTIEWSVSSRRVSTVRIRADEDVIATATGDQTPVVNYSLTDSGPTTLQLEADVEVRLRKQVIVDLGNVTRRWSTVRTDTVTVTDTLDVSVYDLQTSSYDATYPNGDTALSIFHTAPWHGFTVGSEGNDRVRGVWRYYTARDTRWDTLTVASANGTTQRTSDALPVSVHAYPAHVGPRVEPVRNGPTLVDTWGAGHGSPAPSLHENVTVGVVDGPYNRTSGLVVRHDDVDPDGVVVQGIVRGVTANATSLAGHETRTIHTSNLTLERVDVAGDTATLRLELRDASTGDPIVLANPSLQDRRAPTIGIDSRNGYIAIADQRVRTNTSGIAVITVAEPGSYTARYEPESWRATDPAYTGDTAHVAWHPLWTVTGWLNLFLQAIVVFAPFLAALYAGYRLSAFLQLTEQP